MKKSLISLVMVGAMLIVGASLYTSCQKDPCKDVTCQNGGTCTDGTCVCASGYEGTDCGTKMQDKFLGSWKGAASCGSFDETFTVTASSDVTKILIKSTSFWFDCDANGTEEIPIDASATIGSDGKSFTLVSSKYCSNVFELTGNGSVSGTTMVLNMTLVETGAGSTTCNFASLAKQ